MYLYCPCFDKLQKRLQKQHGILCSSGNNRWFMADLIPITNPDSNENFPAENSAPALTKISCQEVSLTSDALAWEQGEESDFYGRTRGPICSASDKD